MKFIHDTWNQMTRQWLRLVLPGLLMSAFVLAQPTVRFAAIGDYGSEGPNLSAVAGLIDSWNVDFIITQGDNNYPNGEAATIDDNIGQYFHQYIFPYPGNYGAGADSNRFFPSLGNHDWRTANAQPYLDYFTLPGNERYYEFRRGPVHFFAIDSDSHEPDGNTANSTQAQWLQYQLSVSTAPWKIVYGHHPPYSSSNHGNIPDLQWPYKQWGADAYLAGHDHVYERIIRDDFLYIVNGLGGRSIYDFGSPVAGSQVRYRGDFGAMLITACADRINFRFYNRSGALIDDYTLSHPVGIAGESNAPPPQQFFLAQNYPNPFNPSTILEFGLPPRGLRNADWVKLKVYDPLGQEIKTLLNKRLNAGTYRVQWDGRDAWGNPVPSGVYFYQLQACGFRQVRKMILIR